MRRNPVLEGEKATQPLQLRLPKLLDRLPAVRSAQHPTDRQQQNSLKRIPFVTFNTGIFKAGKMLDDAGRHTTRIKAIR